MPRRTRLAVATLFLGLLSGAPAIAQDEPEPPAATVRPDCPKSAEDHDAPLPPCVESPPVPEGMTLEEALEYAAGPPPGHFPDPVPDDRWYVFTFLEQFEYRMPREDTPDHFGWEAQGWVGDDLDRFWWKNEGEAVFDGQDEGETEIDMLYSRLISPFWSLQAGAQYAVGWGGGGSEDRWSGVVAVQGLAPYKFEIDSSLYVSVDGDATFELEAEYDVRITQRLVLQPRVEFGVAFDDIPERDLGRGLTDANLDLRLRYEIRRQLAPYFGARYQTLFGRTEDIARAAGRETDQMLLLGGLRFAF